MCDSIEESLDEVKSTISSTGKYIMKHFKIKWIITNVLGGDSTPHFKSPAIDLGEEFGSCYITVAPVFASDYVLLDYLPDDVKNNYSLNYRFGYLRENVAYWQPSFKMNVNNKGYLFDSMEPNDCYDSKSMTLTVLCEFIIILDDPTSDDLNHLEDRQEKDICLDFYNIFKSEYLSDVTLCFKDKTINAHKAILASKSDYLREKIENSSQNKLKLPELEFNFVRSILVFMYGGYEIWSAHYKPDLAFYDFVCDYKVTDLMDFLSPTEINFEESVSLTRSGFSWKINLFETLNGPLINESPLFQMSFGSFKLLFRYDNSSDNASLSMRFIPLNILETIVVGLEIQILDTFEKVLHLGQLSCHLMKGTETGNVTYDFEKFPLIADGVDILKIGDSFTISGCILFSNNKIVKQFSSLKNVTKTPEKCANFQSLLDRDNYSDFRLNVGHFTFSVHKAILGGRCSYFKDLFEKYPKLQSTCAKSVKQSAVENFLIYLYSGNIGDDLESKLELLIILNSYEDYSKEAELRKLVSNAITLENSHTVLLQLHDLRSVEHFQDLKSIALGMICCNFNAVEVSQNWTDLSTHNEEIAREILLHLQEIYKNSDFNTGQYAVFE